MRRAILLLCLLLSACQPLPPAPPPVHAPLTAMQVGIGEDYPHDAWSLDRVRRDLDVMQRAHVRLLRVALAWDQIEPRENQFDFSFWDSFFHEAQLRHIELLPYVCYTPRWNATAPDGYWKQPPRDPAAFARFLTEAVGRYRGQVHTWELWNEPDNADYWAGTPQQFAALIRTGSAAVRAADPSAKVVLGGISWNVSFLRTLFRHEHLSPCIDIVNVHSYYETWIPGPLERLPELIGETRDIISDYGDHQSIWAAEIGYSDYRRGRDVSADEQARFAYEHTANYQAEDLFRSLTLLRCTDAVALTTWYRINDLPTAQDVIGDVNNRHLGIETAAGADKPSLLALRRFNQLLGPPLHVADASCWVNRPAASTAEVHFFQQIGGDIIAVAWLRTDVPGLNATNGQDLRDESFQITIPIRARSAAQSDPTSDTWREMTINSAAATTTINIAHLHGGETRLLRLRAP